MSQASLSKTRTYYALIPDQMAARLLLVDDDTGWGLPRLRSTAPDAFAGGPLDGWVKQQWGLDVTQLRIVSASIDPVDQRWDWVLIAMENHSPTEAPPSGTHWAGRADLATRPLVPPHLGPAIDLWLAERETGAEPPARSPWARPGWWGEISAWVADAQKARGQPLLGPLEQCKVWAISCLLRGQTAAGAVYVKACPTLPLFTNEATMTADLAARYPPHIPAPLAVDRERRWMLLADFGGGLLHDAPRAAWDATVDAFAALQQDSMSQRETLLAAGCLDRRLDRLVAALPTLLDGVRAYSGLEVEHLTAFAAILPHLATACRELAGLGVPCTLVHGDLHDNNIAVVAGQPLFFDWSDACIAHPFLDLSTLLDTPYFDTHPPERESIHDRYLRHWTDYASLTDLRRAADLATRLGHLHQIVSYVSIMSNVEPSARWEYAGSIAYFVRQLLDLPGPGTY